MLEKLRFCPDEHRPPATFFLRPTTVLAWQQLERIASTADRGIGNLTQACQVTQLRCVARCRARILRAADTPPNGELAPEGSCFSCFQVWIGMAIQFQRLQNVSRVLAARLIALLATRVPGASGPVLASSSRHARNTCGQRLIAEFFTKRSAIRGKPSGVGFFTATMCSACPSMRSSDLSRRSISSSCCRSSDSPAAEGD